VRASVQATSGAPVNNGASSRARDGDSCWLMHDCSEQGSASAEGDGHVPEVEDRSQKPVSFPCSHEESDQAIQRKDERQEPCCAIPGPHAQYAGTKDEKESDAELERKPSNHPTGTVIKGSPRWHERELKVEWHIYVPSGRSDVSESVLGSDDHAPMQTRSLSLA
jgi:hypothetical protein